MAQAPRKTRRTKEEKAESHFTAIEVSERVAALTDDPEVIEYFRATENHLIAKMVAADASDDDTRRSAALDLKALLGLKNHLNGVKGKGRIGAKGLERLENKNERQSIN